MLRPVRCKSSRKSRLYRWSEQAGGPRGSSCRPRRQSFDLRLKRDRLGTGNHAWRDRLFFVGTCLANAIVGGTSNRTRMDRSTCDTKTTTIQATNGGCLSTTFYLAEVRRLTKLWWNLSIACSRTAKIQGDESKLDGSLGGILPPHPHFAGMSVLRANIF